MIDPQNDDRMKTVRGKDIRLDVSLPHMFFSL